MADNEDPERIGCVRIQVPGVIVGEKDALPWAYPLFPPGGGSARNQVFRVPNVGDRVAVFFDEMDPYTIWYLGSLVSAGTRDAELTDEAKYPNVYGSTDEQGTRLIVDKDANEVTGRHVSGAMFRVNEGGDGFITFPGNLSIIADGDLRMTGKDVDVNAKDDLRLAAVADLDLTAGADLTAMAAGSMTMSAAQDAAMASGRTLGLSAAVNLNMGAALNVSIRSLASISVQAGASVGVVAGGSATITAGGSAALTAGGSVAVTGGASASLTGGGSARMTAGGTASVRGATVRLN